MAHIVFNRTVLLGDSAELWVTLNAMGYDYNLVQDEAALFRVSVQGELKEFAPSLYVSGLRSGGPILDKATIKCIMEGARQPKVIEAAKDILIFREVAIFSYNWTATIIHMDSCPVVCVFGDGCERAGGA